MTNKPPQQLARELAEKCAVSISAMTYAAQDDVELHRKVIKEGILRELNLEQLIECKQAEKELSDAYLRIRTLVDAFDTNFAGENRFQVTEDKIKQLIADKERCMAQGAINALNVLLWKLGPPSGYPADANSIAGFIIAELADKNITGLIWNSEHSEFTIDSAMSAQGKEE